MGDEDVKCSNDVRYGCVCLLVVSDLHQAATHSICAVMGDAGDNGSICIY
jgi:hypothetical protein